MLFLSVCRHQIKTLAISWSVRHADIGCAIHDLLSRGAQCVRRAADRLKLPAHDFGLRKPPAQFGDDFRRRHQLDKQAADARGDFFGRLERPHFSCRVLPEFFSKLKIADRCRVKDCVHLPAGKRFYFCAQIRRGGKIFDPFRLAGARVSRRLADEQRHLVPARREKIGQLRAEPARGKIREPAHVVQRLERRSGGDDAVHAMKITNRTRRMEA